MSEVFALRVMKQTMRDLWKISLMLSLLFAGMAVMYSSAFPLFKENLEEFAEGFGGFPLRGMSDFTSYAGFLNLELYQIFWLLILGLLIGFLSASLVSREVEGKTIDLVMANPISRKQFIFERYLGILPMILLVNVVTFFAVYGITVAIDETVDVGNLVLTHVVSIPYFFAIAAVGLFVSVLFDEKTRAGIVTVGILMGMYIVQTISLLSPDYENVAYLSLMHYFDPSETLLSGSADAFGLVVLIVVTLECLLVSILFFEKKDIAVS